MAKDQNLSNQTIIHMWAGGNKLERLSLLYSQFHNLTMADRVLNSFGLKVKTRNIHEFRLKIFIQMLLLGTCNNQKLLLMERCSFDVQKIIVR